MKIELKREEPGEINKDDRIKKATEDQAPIVEEEDIVQSHYNLLTPTYAYSLLFYKVCTKRENAGSWNSGLEKEQILKTYSAQLQKS